MDDATVTSAADLRHGGARNPYVVKYDPDYGEAHMGFIVLRTDNVLTSNNNNLNTVDARSARFGFRRTTKLRRSLPAIRS